MNIEMIKHDIWARLRIDTLSCTTPLLEKRSFVIFEEGLVVHDYNIHKQRMRIYSRAMLKSGGSSASQVV
jgi:hypothetical protein